MPDRFEIDHNLIKWSGFFKSDDDAQKHLDSKVAIYAKANLVLSAKKKYSEKKIHDSLMYYFTIVLAPKT